MLWYVGGGAILCFTLALAWLAYGRGPRRGRLHRRALLLLHQGDWRAASTCAEQLRSLGPLSPAWEGRVRNLAGECQRAAGEAALAEKDYETAIELAPTAATLLGLDPTAARTRVLDALKGEVYGSFAGGAIEETRRLLGRLSALQSADAEPSFWTALCYVRGGQPAEALALLRTAQAADKGMVDPPLYLGALLARGGQLPEALRSLSEANRLEPNSPFVGWQLGVALVQAGGDAGLAARALQKALGPRGLPLWVRQPEKAFSEGFPAPARSFVARCAAQQKYVCPVFGDLNGLVRQGFLALAQAHYRLNNFQEAATIYGNLMQEAAPSQAILRGLGLALARLERYDEAFKHLRAAHEMEEPKTATTAGYLALCGARGKPSRADDKPNNVLWAVRLLARFPVLGDAEWAGLYRGVFAEARTLSLPLTGEDLLRACDVFASVEAHDAEAAATYDLLAQSAPASVRPAHAWLFGRAAQVHGLRGAAELPLFAQAFTHGSALRHFYAQRKWDVEELEALYLSRWSETRPAELPEVFGDAYGPAAEQLLLSRSKKLEAEGQADGALRSAAILLRLRPESAAAYDRLACLHYRRGDLEGATRVLRRLRELRPDDPWPALRLAVIEQQRGNGIQGAEAIDAALAMAQGPLRAEIAYLGARLALKDCKAALTAAGEPAFGTIRRFLDICLHERADHAGALALLAALKTWTGEETRELAPRLRRPDVADARFQLFAASALFKADDAPAALEAAERAIGDPALAIEARYLTGLAHVRRNEPSRAVAALEKVVRSPEAASVDHARAWLGSLHFESGNYEGAVFWWKAIEAARRAAWKLDDALRGALFLDGLVALEERRYAAASEKLREAGRLGWRDRRLGPLLQLSLFKAGQRLLYPPGDEAPSPGEAAPFLAQAISTGCKDPAAGYLLALAYKHADKPTEARAALRKLDDADANAWLQRGILSLREGALAQAETEFARAWELEPNNVAAGENLLLTRLSLGQTESAAPLAERLLTLADDAERRVLAALHALLQTTDESRARLSQLSSDDERHLIERLRGLGHLDTVCLLLHGLAQARPDSGPVRAAHFEALLLKGRKLVDRCDWGTAQRLLTPLLRQRDMAEALHDALGNLVGCCASLSQDFAAGIRHFNATLHRAPNNSLVHQNLALVYEWQRDQAAAEPHWNRYLDLLERRLTPSPDSPQSSASLLFDALHRLATGYTEKEKWLPAIGYVERAHRLRPDDAETLERLFTLYNQTRRPDDARRVLQRLRHLRPGEAHYELYELDLVELRHIDDIDRWIGDIGRVVQRHPGEARVEERALSMIGNALPLLNRTAETLTEQLNKVMRQVRGLDRGQVNWAAVHEVMRDLKRDFSKLRKTVARCLAVVTHPDQRRQLRTLGEHVDRKIEFCRDWQGN